DAVFALSAGLGVASGRGTKEKVGRDSGRARTLRAAAGTAHQAVRNDRRSAGREDRPASGDHRQNSEGRILNRKAEFSELAGSLRNRAGLLAGRSFAKTSRGPRSCGTCDERK